MTVGVKPTRRRPSRLVARLKATYACPNSKQPPRLTSRFGIVMPWDLWIEMAHASFRGTCTRDASLLLPISTLHSSGSTTATWDRCPPPTSNRTLGRGPHSGESSVGSKPTTTPRAPLTKERVTSTFLRSMTWLPTLSSREVAAWQLFSRDRMKLSSPLSTAAKVRVRVPLGSLASSSTLTRSTSLFRLKSLVPTTAAAFDEDDDDGREARALSDWRCTALRRAMVFSLGFPDRQSLRRRTNSSSRCLGKRVHWVNV
jgi:hypothetical protein